MTAPQAEATLLVEDDRVKVTRFDFAPAAETGWHEHGMDYVITTLTACHMRLEEPDGTTREVHFDAGSSYSRPRGVKHNVINAGTAAMSFVEVELK